MAGSIADLMVKITGDAGGLKTSLKEAETSTQGFASKLGGVGSMAAAGFGAAAVAIGAFAMKSAADVGGAYKDIEKQTGQTGASLDGLKTSFNNVYGNFPIDSKSAATAVSTVFDRLKEMSGGIAPTNEQVTNLTSSFEEFAKVTGTDVATDTDQLTRVFAQFKVSASDMPNALNDLTQAAQYTHVPISQLQGDLQKAGPQFSEMGIGIGEATASLATMDSSGLKSRQVMSALSAAMSPLEKAGEAPKKAFGEVADALDRYNKTGERTGPIASMSEKQISMLGAAAKSGAFHFDTLTGKMYTNAGAMKKSYEDTLTFSDKLTIFKNKLEVAFAPLGKALINILSALLGAISPLLPIVTAIATAFGNLPTPILLVISAGAALLGGIGALNIVLGKFGISLKSLPGDIGKVGSEIKGLASSMLGIKQPPAMKAESLIGGGGKSDCSKLGVDPGCFDKLVKGGKNVEGEMEQVAAKSSKVGGILNKLPDPISNLLTKIPGIGGGLGEASVAAEGLAGASGEAAIGIEGAAAGSTGLLGSLGGAVAASGPLIPITATVAAGLGVMALTSGTFRGMLGGVATSMQTTAGWAGDVVGKLTSGDLSGAAAKLKDGFQGAIDAIAHFDFGAWAGKMVTSVGESAGTIKNLIGGAFDSIKNIDWGGIFAGALDAVSGFLDKLLNFDPGPMIDSLINAIGGAFDSLFGGGGKADVKGQTTGGGKADLGAHLSKSVEKAGPDILGKLGNVFVKLVALLPTIFLKVTTALVTALQKVDWGAVWTDLVNMSKKAWGVVIDFLKNLDWGALWNDLVNMSKTAWGMVIDFLKNLDWGGFAKTVWNALTTAIGQIITWLKGLDWGSYAKTVWEALKSSNALGKIVDWIKSLPWGTWAALLWQDIQNALKGFGTWLLGAAVNFFTGLPGKITSAISGFGAWLMNAASGFFVGLPGRITSAVSGFGAWLMNAASGFFVGFPGKLTGAVNTAKSAFTGLGQAIVQGFKDLWNSLPGIDFLPPIGHFPPKLAGGAIISAVPGGMLAVIGEGRGAEAVVPESMFWGINPAVLNALPKMGGGGVIGNVSTMARTEPAATGTTQRESVYYNLYISVDSENISRKVFEGIRELEAYHHL